MRALPEPVLYRFDLTSAVDRRPVIGHAGLTAGSGQVEAAFENIADFSSVDVLVLEGEVISLLFCLSVNSLIIIISKVGN